MRFVHQRRTFLHGFLGIENTGQRLIDHLDQAQGFLGYIGIAMSVLGLIFLGSMFAIGIRMMYEIWQQMESGAGGQWTESLSLLRLFV